MASIEELYEVRRSKLDILKSKGVNPYPATSSVTHTVAEAIQSFDDFVSTQAQCTLGGRVMSLRAQGAIIFFNFFDGTDTFQALVKKGDMEESDFELFVQTVDMGDFVEVSGPLFLTRAGQKTIQAKKWNMLSKSLRPLPEKWHGLTDVEERYRKRYLDLLGNNELREMFIKKAVFWNTIRQFLISRGFLEVETPTLERTTGGAEANPFKTHHKDFDIDVYLRISVGELWQKRLMAAGFPKTFEIGRVYRNEGSSPEHTQEFTNCEFYAAYMDYKNGMKLVEELIKEAAQKAFGTLSFEARGFSFDIGGEWKVQEYVPTIEEMTGVNVLTADEATLRAKLDELGVAYEGENKERLTDTLWKYCRKKITGPVWMIHYPKLVSPLAKSLPDNPLLTEKCQLVLAGSEVTNGFSELNDPLDQKERFEVQQKLLEAGDEEAMMPEWEFVEMLEHGMPPTFGCGFGERLFSFFAGKPLRETQLFPLMKPLEDK